MIPLSSRINAFASLGVKMGNMLSGADASAASEFAQVASTAEDKNPWFTQPNIRRSMESIAYMLSENELAGWANRYAYLGEQRQPKVVAVVMAGNIPAVGFHDMLCVFASGNKILAKLSSKDNILLPFIAEVLCRIEPGFKPLVQFESEIIRGFDAVIATGSDNSARYFDYYFKKYPSVIRKNRCSVAVLDGNETDAELGLLAADVFMYFGLGCRNVSKLFVPESYDMTRLLSIFDKSDEVSTHSKYMNNYEYNKSIYLLNRQSHLDNGFVLLTEDSNFFSPIAVVFFEKYTDISITREHIDKNIDKLQCIVSNVNIFKKQTLAFGVSQKPRVFDYADEVDTMKFLETI